MKIWNSEKCIVGEGPLWDERTSTLWFLDIRGKCLYKTCYPDGQCEKISLPQRVGCMALCEDGNVLAAMEDGVYRVDTMTLAHQSVKIKGDRFNDGKVGPDGAFYLGTSAADGNGAFYRLKNGILTELFDGCACSNGLDWTADGKTMYYIDTPRQMVEQFDFDSETGSISNRRKFADIPAQWGKPDGMTLDENGDLWIALWDGHGVIHLDKTTGQLLEKIEIPCKKASCCCFGGKDRNILFITSAAYEDETPQAGKTFAVELTVKGKNGFYFRGE